MGLVLSCTSVSLIDRNHTLTNAGTLTSINETPSHRPSVNAGATPVLPCNDKKLHGQCGLPSAVSKCAMVLEMGRPISVMNRPTMISLIKGSTAYQWSGFLIRLKYLTLKIE